MKKTIVCMFLFLFILFFSAYAQDSIDYFELNKIKTINYIMIVNQQREASLFLNKEQAEAFINKLKVSRKLSPRKIRYPYKVEISYEDKTISFMTNGKTLGQSGTSEMYELSDDCSDIMKSVFDIYDAFLNPLFVTANILKPVWAGTHYLLQKKDNNRYYALAVVYGSGLPVISIKTYDAIVNNNFIDLDEEKILITNNGYELYRDGKKIETCLENYTVENLKTDMHGFYLYHH